MSSASSSTDASSSPNVVQNSLQPESTLVDRAQKTRGKLPKETTDYLKDWLHRHAEHPYPTDEEKKQMCAETGLTMSQISNWMINARRRILAPLQRERSNSLAPSCSEDHIPLVRPHSVDSPLVRQAYMTEALDFIYPTCAPLPPLIPSTVPLNHQTRPHLPHASYSSPGTISLSDASVNTFPGYTFTEPTPQARSAYAAAALQAECELRAVNMLKSYSYWDNTAFGL